jgi:hypothetical protein
MKQLILLLLFAFFGNLKAQDSVSVFFETGKYHLKKGELSSLNMLSSRYELAAVDSVDIIGMADSIGNFRSNLKLSLKRANTVREYLDNVFPPYLPIRVLAMGEKNSGQNGTAASRRVDVVLYFHPDTADIAELAEHKEGKAIETCYEVDYDLLHRCHKRTIVKNKTAYMLLELDEKTDLSLKGYYYASVNRTGKIQVKSLKWQVKKSGRSWWRKIRYLATIPKGDYLRYRIFVKKPPPCSDCSQKLNTNNAIPNETTCMSVDYFLMNNLQVKKVRGNHALVKVRVPREYIDPEAQYYSYSNDQKALVWETKSGKKNKHYYFTTLPVINEMLSNIVKETECCIYNYSHCKDCHDLFRNCGGCHCHTVNGNWKLILEAGYNYYPDRHQAYTGLGLSNSWKKTDLFFIAGMDHYKSLYLSAKVDYNFISFRFKQLNPFKTWGSPESAFTYSSYARLYAGTEVRGAFLQEKTSFAGQNLHLGLAWVNVDERALIPRVFLQAGAGYNYSGLSGKQLHLLVQAGINIKILRF